MLGRRFSPLVAIQPGHTLIVTGPYRYIRHPSYVGFITISLGWSLAFRSLLGLLFSALLLIPLTARIRAEEALLGREFGAAYDAYRARTARLLPRLW